MGYCLDMLTTNPPRTSTSVVDQIGNDRMLLGGLFVGVFLMRADSASLRSFFQPKDGIRDIGVTGFQPCALPIFADVSSPIACRHASPMPRTGAPPMMGETPTTGARVPRIASRIPGTDRMVPIDTTGLLGGSRSEERRVGKECRSRGSPYH